MNYKKLLGDAACANSAARWLMTLLDARLVTALVFASRIGDPKLF